MKYVVKTIGRSGSHIITEYFYKKGFLSLYNRENKLLELVNKNWKSVQKIYYGDEIDIKLDLPDVKEDFYVQKSNINYEQVVSNYNELKEIYIIKYYQSINTSNNCL